MGRDHSLIQERADGVQMFFSFGFELKREARNRGIRDLRSIPAASCKTRQGGYAFCGRATVTTSRP
jgi:hypothetical protein